MSFMDALAVSSAPRPRCTVPSALDHLEPGVRAEVVTAMADPEAVGSAISRALILYGVHLAGGTIQRHRNGVCSCVVR